MGKATRAPEKRQGGLRRTTQPVSEESSVVVDVGAALGAGGGSLGPRLELPPRIEPEAPAEPFEFPLTLD